MDEKNKFLEKLFRMYPLVFNEHNIPDWYQAYSMVLWNENINYNLLFKNFVMNWSDMTKAPSPKWFQDIVSLCIETSTKPKAVVEMEKARQESVPMPEEFSKKLQALKRKMVMGEKYAICG